MTSIKQIRKLYAKLQNDVETQDFYDVDLTNRVNCYICKKCGHITKTKDIDAGVTPFIFKCEKCSGEAHSTFFNDIAPAQKPTFEWFRPSLEEVIKMRKKPAMLDHVLRGGLDYRKCTETVNK